MLLARAIRKGQVGILVTAWTGKKAKNSWFESVWSDLLWLAMFSPQLVELRSASLVEWIDFFTRNGNMAVKAVRKACKSTGMQHRTMRIAQCV